MHEMQFVITRCNGATMKTVQSSFVLGMDKPPIEHTTSKAQLHKTEIHQNALPETLALSPADKLQLHLHQQIAETKGTQLRPSVFKCTSFNQCYLPHLCYPVVDGNMVFLPLSYPLPCRLILHQHCPSTRAFLAPLLPLTSTKNMISSRGADTTAEKKTPCSSK